MDGSISPILKLTPFADEKIWGGEKLKKIKNILTESPVGETLEISTLKKMNSMVGKKPLMEICGELSFLVKLIETTDHLSVQVHPDDEYAQKNEQTKGKSECWLILSAEQGAGIYLGFKKGVTKEVFSKTVKENGEVNKLLNFIPVKKGDFFFVPAGTIHAIGAGLLLVEVQQNCGVTYRVWDWNRLGLDGKPRELHFKKAMDVIEFDENRNTLDYFSHQNNCFEKLNRVQLSNHPDFKFDLLINQSKINLEKNKPIGLINLSDHSVSITRSQNTTEMKPLESVLLPNGFDQLVKINTEISFLGLVY